MHCNNAKKSEKVPLQYSSPKHSSYLDNNYSTGNTANIIISDFNYEDTTESPDEGDEIIGQTWKYATKSGDKDYRHKDNWKVFKLNRYGVSLRLENHSEWELGHLSQDIQAELFTAFIEMFGIEVIFDQQEDCVKGEAQFDDSENSYEENEQANQNQAWYEILEVSRTASEYEIIKAWKEKIKQYHPDRVAGLGEKLRAVAEQESKKLNAGKEQGLIGK